MIPVLFSDKLFQRGQTWDECLGCWVFERKAFLGKVARRPLLPSTAKRLSRLARGARMAVYYSDGGLDSFRALPAIGTTLAGQGHLEVRYFCMEIFLPIFRKPLGRKTPLILMVDEHGDHRARWGPRAEPLRRALEALNHPTASERDLWLMEFDDNEFDMLTDRSIADRL